MRRRFTEADLLAMGQKLEPTVVTAVRSKYGNKRIEGDGYVFDSKAEAARYWTLRLEQKAGLITGLEVHPRYDLKVCDYVADFRYRRGNHLVVEDCKSKPTCTRAYRIKKKLMKLFHEIDVVEIFNARA